MPSITGPVIAAGVGAAGSIASGAMNAGAASDAAKAQVDAANASAGVQRDIYNQTRSDLAPFLQSGQGALAQLSKLLGIGGTGGPNNEALMGALEQYPGYQFSLQQGLKAVNQSGAARGLLNSGATIRNATQFGQGLAQSTLGDYLSRLGGLANLGESAGSITGNTGASAGANIGNSLLAGGSAAGAGIMGSSMALTGGLNSGLNSALLAYQLSQQGGGGAPGWGSYTGNFSEFM